MSKMLLEKIEVFTCYGCYHARYIGTKKSIDFSTNQWQQKCSKKRPHKIIDNSEIIPEWCPLPNYNNGRKAK